MTLEVARVRMAALRLAGGDPEISAILFACYTRFGMLAQETIFLDAAVEATLPAQDGPDALHMLMRRAAALRACNSLMQGTLHKKCLDLMAPLHELPVETESVGICRRCGTTWRLAVYMNAWTQAMFGAISQLTDLHELCLSRPYTRPEESDLKGYEEARYLLEKALRELHP